MNTELSRRSFLQLLAAMGARAILPRGKELPPSELSLSGVPIEGEIVSIKEPAATAQVIECGLPQVDFQGIADVSQSIFTASWLGWRVTNIYFNQEYEDTILTLYLIQEPGTVVRIPKMEDICALHFNLGPWNSIQEGYCTRFSRGVDASQQIRAEAEIFFPRGLTRAQSVV